MSDYIVSMYKKGYDVTTIINIVKANIKINKLIDKLCLLEEGEKIEK